MYPIKWIKIEGFRGILLELELDFRKGRNPASMIVYGHNGTGKSSITDAWEWFHTDYIGHLRREGAGPSAYCHRQAKSEESYVEICFADQALNTVRLCYDQNRVTMPVATGNISAARELMSHPCHIRYGDLTRFVYLTKTERFDELAKLMGFLPQVEFQKSLRRVAGKIDKEIENVQTLLDEKVNKLKSKLGITEVNLSSFVNSVAGICESVGIHCAKTFVGVQQSGTILKGELAQDPIAQQLSDLKSIRDSITDCTIPNTLFDKVKNYSFSVEPFKQQEADLSNILLEQLYDIGEQILSEAADKAICPLCDQVYDGNLFQHIQSKHHQLKELVSKYKKFEAERKELLTELQTKAPLFVNRLGMIEEKHGLKDHNVSINVLTRLGGRIDLMLDSLVKAIKVPVKGLEIAAISALKDQLEPLQNRYAEFESERSGLVVRLNERIKELEADERRKKLVEADSVVSSSIEIWEDLDKHQKRLGSLTKVKSEFEKIVDRFVDDSSKDVETRFEKISDNVKKYFDILEKNTPEVGSPTLRLLRDQDRSVVLEIVFQGETISPAYKYLSESQMNSFGLVVFLASVREFNEHFKFVILDDVINSFDAYKRPQVLTLLREEFADFQILLLTHDLLWKENIYRSFPEWVRKEFYDYAPSVGPLVRDGKHSLQRIQELNNDDHPEEAGRNLGPYLEGQLQHICESFEVLVKYNVKNEYTLDPLFSYLIKRVKDKLGENHCLTKYLEMTWTDSVFRNFCVHWRNSSSTYTKPEMQSVLDNWIQVERMVYCQETSCGQLVRYDRKRSFVCPCKSTRLEKTLYPTHRAG